jgi:hypothetical protein
LPLYALFIFILIWMYTYKISSPHLLDLLLGPIGSDRNALDPGPHVDDDKHGVRAEPAEQLVHLTHVASEGEGARGA